MLQITVPISPEGWDEERQEFVDPQVKTLQLEHSLVSISNGNRSGIKLFCLRKIRQKKRYSIT